MIDKLIGGNMQINLDIAIVAVFLFVNLVAGLYSGRGIRTIKEYAIGNRNFSTATIAATIVATWISGSFFAVHISQTYKDGLWFFVAAVGNISTFLMIGYFFAPKMKEFFGNLSVAETMGNLYGKNMRLITAVASIAHAVGMTALQIKVFSSIFSHFLGFSSIYATWISSFVVIIYSAFGGIKAVTFTDVIQFFTFGVFLPIFAIFIWQVFGSSELIVHTFNTNQVFDYHQLFNPSNPKFWPALFVVLYYLFPNINSAMFQRTLMAKDTKQISQSFTIAAVVCFFIVFFTCFIGLVVLSHDATLDPNNVAMYAIDNYSFTGLKGFAIVGIMAMIMSTADSWINTASVIFAHDFCYPLGIKLKNELFLSRVFTILVGIGAVFMALSSTTLLDLVLLKSNFYRPIVAIPLLLAILGFRSTPKAVFIGVITGTFTIIIWKSYIQPLTSIDSVMPSMFANLVAFIGAHYVLGEPGGWIKIKKDEDNEEEYRKKIRKEKIANFFSNFPQNLADFSLVEYCKARAPKQERVYSYFAFGVLSTIITTFSLDKVTYQQHTILINLLQGSALFISTIFICHRLWPSEFREKYIGLIWYLSIFSLAFISSFLVLINQFSQMSLVIFILNLTMIGVLLNWQTTLLMVSIGVYSAFICYELYFGNADLSLEFYSLKLKIVYVLLMISAFLLTFLKPKQELQELTEEKVDHLSYRITDREQALTTANGLQNEFIRNLTHEFHAPMTGVRSTAETLYETYDLITEKMRKMAVENIYKSAVRLEVFERNLELLSRLANAHYNLNFVKLDLSQLVYERVEKCMKMYIEEKDQGKPEFILQIENGITANCDAYHIRQTIDNLIINAISYCQQGTITVSLMRKDEEIEFAIKDEGIGVPPEEIYDIFGTFIVSSRTRTPAGGRGIGLALCKKVIDLHQGRIWAENNQDKGATFRFVIPVV